MEEQLNITVLQENLPVTYKSLARTQNIHVNTAKQALWDYAQSTPNVHAIYCIAGRLMTDNNTDTIRLVKDLDLEGAKKQFRQITGVHVYSVIPYDPMDLSVLVTANKEIPYLTIQDRVRCGVLECSKVLEPKPKKQPTPAQSAPSSKPSTSAFDTTSSPIKTTSPPADTKTSTASSSKKSTPTKKKGTLSFGKHAVKAKSPSPQIQEKQPTPEPKKPSLQASDIFSDDEDMAEPSPVRDPEHTPVEPMDEDPMDMDEEPVPAQEQASEPQEAVVTTPKKRHLESNKPTTREYTDDRGFWVTETVGPPKRETPPPQPQQQRTIAKPTSAKKAPAKKKQGTQSSLLSLWGKK